MKRLIMFVVPLLLVIGISNAQQVSNWKQVQLTWSDETTQTILQGETKYTDAITLSETIFGSAILITGVAEHEKFPIKLSFGLIVAENTGDSSNVVHTLQVSGDGDDFYDYSVITTSLSVATANETYAKFELMFTFPDLKYVRVKSVFASGITDTVDLSGWLGKKFTQ